jgi:PEGA domain
MDSSTTDLDSIPPTAKAASSPSLIGFGRLTCARKHVTGVFLFLFAASISFAQTKTSFDKFKNKTHFMTEETRTSKVTYDGGKDASILIHHIGMVVAFSCDGQVDSCKPSAVELLFIGYTSDWTMKGNNEINFLIDGKAHSAGKADWDGQVLNADALVEYNDATINPELLAELVEAKRVDVQIGLFEFSLTDANLASIRDIATHGGWVPEALKKTLLQNNEMSKASPAAAAQFAQDGRTHTPQELAQLIQDGQASKTGIVTNPAGAEVYLDGNKVGVTPVSFVLLKRESPRILTIKLAGYKTVEKQLIPDGKTIPIGLTLEKE